MLGAFHRQMNDWLQRLKKRPAGNVALQGNLYEQVRIAYALATDHLAGSVGDAARMNLFPTDCMPRRRDALRELAARGRARLRAGETARRVVISEVDAASFQRCMASARTT
jgi:hypothetical protein